jgi:hypothetical protein
MGLLFDQRRREWLVVNQNIDLHPVTGEVLRFDKSRNFLGALVPRTDINADPRSRTRLP